MVISKTAGYQLAGILLLVSALASLGCDFAGLPAVITGVLHIIVIVLGWGLIPVSVRKLSLLLITAGFVMLYAAGAVWGDYISSLSKNRSMISMLAGVGFLRLIPLVTAGNENPVGRKALWQTMLGVSWLGAFINVSSIVMFADRMSGSSYRLKPAQALVLTRGFIMAALWSPFFVAMAVAVSHAKGADIWKLMLFGLPFSHLVLFVAGMYTIYTMKEEVNKFEGYPFKPETLKGPVILAAAVFAAHIIWPDVSVIAFVTMFAPLYTLFKVRKDGPILKFSGYTLNDLPKMSAEVCLFWAAGFFGAGISALISHGIFPAVTNTGNLVASYGGLAVITAASVFGIHPIVSISSVGAMLEHANVLPDLLAMSFLMGWVMVLINPISGIHLLVSVRYGFDNKNVWRWNSGFTAIYFILCCAWLYLCNMFM